MVETLRTSWSLAKAAPGHAMVFALRSIIPFGISFRDLEGYRISTWRHGRLPRVHLTRVFPGIDNVKVELLNLYQRKLGLSIDAHELMVLCANERFVEAKNVLEIGTYDGNTTLNLAANVSAGGHVTTIDLPADWDQQFVYDVPESRWNVTNLQRVGAQYQNTPYADRIRQVLGDSAKVDFGHLDPPFDMIFIDGNHFRDYVKKDTENALQHLRPGGVVVWHDYGDIKDVSKVVDEAARHITAYVVRGTRLAVGWHREHPVSPLVSVLAETRGNRL